MIETTEFSVEQFRTRYIPEGELSEESEFEHEGYIVFSWGGGGYDWDQFDIVASKVDGRLFTAWGSGCSCNSLYDGVVSLDGPSGLGASVTKAEALNEVKEWESGGESTYRAADRKGAHAAAMEAMFRWEKATGL